MASHPYRFAVATVSLLAVSLCGCGKESPKSTVAASEADQVEAGFVFDLAREAALDDAALKAAQPGESVVTLYFDGGMSRNCARWDFTLVASNDEELRLPPADPSLTPQAFLSVATADGATGGLVGKFQTRGPLEGQRLLAPAGAQLRLKGIQDFCLTKDATEFNVKVQVEPVGRKRLFTGVEAAGQTAVRVRVSEAKPAADE